MNSDVRKLNEQINRERDNFWKRIVTIKGEKTMLLDALKKIGSGDHLDTCQWMLNKEYVCTCHVSIACIAHMAVEE